MKRSTKRTASLGHFKQPAFHRFPDFPLEIREAIWELVEDERVIEVLFNPLTFQFYHDTPPPVTLYVSSEARAVALRRYKVLTVEYEPDDAMREIYQSDVAYYFRPKNGNVKPKYHPDDITIGISRELLFRWGTSRHQHPTEGTPLKYHPFTTYIDYRCDTLYMEGNHTKHFPHYWPHGRDFLTTLMEFLKLLVSKFQRGSLQEPSVNCT